MDSLPFRRIPALYRHPHDETRIGRRGRPFPKQDPNPTQKAIPTSQQFDGEKFFTIENGKRIATPLLLVLIMIELSDVIFAVDSIPAIFAVTTDPFIVLTSNIFAILGLRAMYFLLADFAERFIFLKYGLAFVLSFIGIKMLIMHWVHIPISISLSVVFGALGASILTSLVYTRQQEKK